MIGLMEQASRFTWFTGRAVDDIASEILEGEGASGPSSNLEVGKR